MSSKDDRASERRAQILQAAAVVFAHNGFDGARMDDIVTESGLSKGTLYWYFDSKQEMAVALVEEVVSAQYEQLRALLDSPGTVVERLGMFLETYASVMTSQPILAPLGVEIYAMAGRVSRVREFITDYYERYIDILDNLMRQGEERGELSVDDPRSLALNLTAFIEGLTLLWTVDPDRVDLARQLRDALVIIFRDRG